MARIATTSGLAQCPTTGVTIPRKVAAGVKVPDWFGPAADLSAVTVVDLDDRPLGVGEGEVYHQGDVTFMAAGAQRSVSSATSSTLSIGTAAAGADVTVVGSFPDQPAKLSATLTKGGVVIASVSTSKTDATHIVCHFANFAGMTPGVATVNVLHNDGHTLSGSGSLTLTA